MILLADWSAAAASHTSPRIIRRRERTLFIEPSQCLVRQPHLEPHSMMRTEHPGVACGEFNNKGTKSLTLIRFVALRLYVYIPAMYIEVTRTYLRLERPEDLNPAHVDDAHIRIVRVIECPGSAFCSLYRRRAAA